ncbi:hypothetical protein OAM82_01300 [Candidatus Thioglobus sp.]|nr:hypothetical protein [Candidatus Thioglobus sp.]
MKKLLILLFISLSLTAQSSTGPTWFDAPLKACFKAAEEGVFIEEGKTRVFIDAPKRYGGKKKCGVMLRNFIYDEKEFSLNRVLKRYPASPGSSVDLWCSELYAARYAFCEYTEFNNLKDVKPFYYK